MAYGLIQGTRLGAPNVYRAPDELRRTLGAERMDICAFVGVAPRGPCRVPVEPEAASISPRAYVEAARPRRRSVAVPVESWSDYQRVFGGYEGPGRLPYAVASFFEQGGKRAYIVRIVHDYGGPDNFSAVARAEIPGLISSGALPTLAAKNEGTWGNRLRAALGYSLRPLELLPGTTALDLRIALDQVPPLGSLLRLTVPLADATPEYHYRFALQTGRRGLSDQFGSEGYLLLSAVLPVAPVTAELVEAELLIEDGAGVSEHFAGLGLAPEHPRSLAAVLYRESQLANPEESWLDASFYPVDPHLPPRSAQRQLSIAPIGFSGGIDRYEDIEHEDFFDRSWVPGNPEPGDGIQALTQLQDLASLVVPDLYVPEPLPAPEIEEPVLSLAGADFAPCVDLPPPGEIPLQMQHALPKLLLDPLLPADLAAIVALQQEVVGLAVGLARFVALLDVPPGISQRAITQWRSHFGSAFCAAYYPWLKIASLDDARDALILVNPSAAAAGIIARQEITFGVPHGPANCLALGVVSVDEVISPTRHDQLHPMGINIFLPKRDGVWLSAARTLSRDPNYRQLSVRRLMTMLQRALYRQMQWVVFEPNHPGLWVQVRHLLINFLRQLYVAGAFKGRREEQAFFVRCDGELNNQRVLDAGQLIVEIGVAPAEPLEFIVVRIVRDGDGTLAVEA